MDDLKRLKELRLNIDDVDDKILELLNKRASLVIDIGKIKLEGKRDFHAPEREKEIYQRLSSNNKGPFPNQALKNVFREIMSASLSLEKPLKVAYLGPKATFTHQACMQYFGLSAERPVCSILVFLQNLCQKRTLRTCSMMWRGER